MLVEFLIATAIADEEVDVQITEVQEEQPKEVASDDNNNMMSEEKAEDTEKDTEKMASSETEDKPKPKKRAMGTTRKKSRESDEMTEKANQDALSKIHSQQKVCG